MYIVNGEREQGFQIPISLKWCSVILQGYMYILGALIVTPYVTVSRVVTNVFEVTVAALLLEVMRQIQYSIRVAGQGHEANGDCPISCLLF